MSNLKKFVLVDTLLLATFFGLFGNWIFNGTGAKVLGALVALLTYGWIQADIIHRLSGVPLNNKKRLSFAKFSDLDHKSFALLNKYWLADSFLFLVVGIAYVAAFQRSNWKHDIGIGLLLIAMILLKLYENRYRIKGISKKELFQ